MKFDLVALAEGATTDARGALALVGMNQRVVSPPTFPAQLKQTIAVLITDETEDGFAEDSAAELEVQLVDVAASTQPRFALTVGLASSPKPWSDLPQFRNFVTDIPFVAEHPGVYELRVVLRTGNEQLDSALRRIYVTDPALVASTPDETGQRALSRVEDAP